MLCAGRGLTVGKPDLHVAPQQCSGSLVAPHPQLSGKISDVRCSPSTLFSRLSLSSLFLISKLKTLLKGRFFQTIEDIQENATRELRAITESGFQEAFKQWKKCWEWCIASRWDCFEGNSA